MRGEWDQEGVIIEMVIRDIVTAASLAGVGDAGGGGALRVTVGGSRSVNGSVREGCVRVYREMQIRISHST